MQQVHCKSKSNLHVSPRSTQWVGKHRTIHAPTTLVKLDTSVFYHGRHEFVKHNLYSARLGATMVDMSSPNIPYTVPVLVLPW